MDSRTSVSFLGIIFVACTTHPLATRSAHIACGGSRAARPSDTASFDVALDSAAAATVNELDLELVGGTAAAGRLRMDSLVVSCSSSSQSFAVSLAGSWRQAPFIQVGTGSHFARARVHAGDRLLVDTVLDMTGNVYRKLKWTTNP